LVAVTPARSDEDEAKLKAQQTKDEEERARDERHLREVVIDQAFAERRAERERLAELAAVKEREVGYKRKRREGLSEAQEKALRLSDRERQAVRRVTVKRKKEQVAKERWEQARDRRRRVAETHAAIKAEIEKAAVNWPVKPTVERKRELYSSHREHTTNDCIRRYPCAVCGEGYREPQLRRVRFRNE
jgi:hypothetical protein